MDMYLVFDVGGTFIKYAVITENGEIIGKDKTVTPKEDLDTLCGTLKKILNIIIEKYKIRGISFSMPGAYNEGTGVIEGWSALPYLHGPNIKEIFEERFGYKVYIENDANCGALGELWIGAGKEELTNFVYVVLGTGIGGSIVINRQLYKGSSNQGGEFGNMVFDKEWYKNQVLGIGDTASTIGLVKNVAKKKNISTSDIDGETIFKLAKEKDEVCIAAINEFYRQNALLLLNIQFSLDPEKIIISGAVASQKDFYNKINEKIAELLDKNISFKVTPRIKISDIPFDSNMYGALYNLLLKENRL
jgi:predicted NBD/HSP70 family sugar kinase